VSRPYDPTAFLRAFRDTVGGCRMDCACGLTYYEPDGGWDWERGELEALEADPKARRVDYTPGLLTFEGRSYVDGCTCWHQRAQRIEAFIQGHDREIAAYLNERAERMRATAAATEVKAVTT
jgi:hypothetical protein